MTTPQSKSVEKKVAEIVNPFIEKWCGANAAHLLDNDENDGEELRQILTQALQEEEQAVRETKRLREALDWIAIVANVKSPHLGRPRSSDTSCIFCMAYLALNEGAYGEYIDYKALADAKRKEWEEKKAINNKEE